MFAPLIPLLSLLAPAVLAADIPLGNYFVQNLGIATDPASQKPIYHDGGGGAYQNGYHVQVFADSTFDLNGDGMVHNSVAYSGYRVKDNPLDLYTFGLEGPSASDAVSFKMTPLGPQGNETDVSFAIWMLSGMTPLSDGKTILGVFPAIIESNTIENLYSTMVSMEVVDPTTLAAGEAPPFNRLGSGRLFYPNEVQYGTFALVEGLDGYLYMAGSDSTGIKLARVPADISLVSDRNHYDYYNSATGKWQPQTPLEKDNAEGNILSWHTIGLAGQQLGPDVGDMWYDNYHERMVMLWGDSGIDGQVWFSYTVDNDLTGEWSTPEPIWVTPVPEECQSTQEAWNYQIHAHPGWDMSGKTLMISYASCAEYVSYAKITWG